MNIRILNPVYDSVFKILLENTFVAKGLISRIIGYKIKELTALPSERAKDKLMRKYNIAIYRLDFVALIENEHGEPEHLIIEMQKSAITPHLDRFRQYLGDELRRKVPVKQKNGKTKFEFLPITTIYFIEKSFNKKLPPILFADKKYFDVLGNKEYTQKVGKLVKCLTNKAFFIQTENLPPDMKGDLEILNTFSNQLVIKEEGDGQDLVLEIPYDDIDNIKDPVYREVVKILMALVGDDKLKRQMRDERIYENYLDQMEMQLREKDQAIEQKDQALEQKDDKIRNTVQLMKRLGATNEQIHESTGLSTEEIDKL